MRHTARDVTARSPVRFPSFRLSHSPEIWDCSVSFLVQSRQNGGKKQQQKHKREWTINVGTVLGIGQVNVIHSKEHCFLFWFVFSSLYYYRNSYFPPGTRLLGVISPPSISANRKHRYSSAFSFSLDPFSLQPFYSRPFQRKLFPTSFFSNILLPSLLLPPPW